jgi:hypothetical protein
MSCPYSDMWQDRTGDVATPQGAMWIDCTADWATQLVQSRVDKWHPSGLMVC